KGNLVIIAADRTAKHNKMKNTPVNFLGEEAWFPQGAFILASLLECPIYYMFALREDDRDLNSPYEFHVYKSKSQFKSSRKERKQTLAKCTQEYAEHLEKLCLEHPFQWFNFFDFWEKPAP
nr:glycosyl transferase family 2 [Spirochaetaceae bacterium]